MTTPEKRLINLLADRQRELGMTDVVFAEHISISPVPLVARETRA